MAEQLPYYSFFLYDILLSRFGLFELHTCVNTEYVISRRLFLHCPVCCTDSHERASSLRTLALNAIRIGAIVFSFHCISSVLIVIVLAKDAPFILWICPRNASVCFTDLCDCADIAFGLRLNLATESVRKSSNSESIAAIAFAYWRMYNSRDSWNRLLKSAKGSYFCLYACSRKQSFFPSSLFLQCHVHFYHR